MLRQFIAIMLMLLFIGQSIAAAADVHLETQTDSGHQEAVHTHDASLMSEGGLLHGLVDAVSDHEQSHDNEPENLLDCQHCCHCHGGTQGVAAMQWLFVLQTLDAYHVPHIALISIMNSPPALRPPIV